MNERESDTPTQEKDIIVYKRCTELRKKEDEEKDEDEKKSKGRHAAA